MQMTQEDFETRAARLDDGTSQNRDEDQRIVDQYEQAGWSRRSAAPTDEKPTEASAATPVTETEDGKGGRSGRASTKG